MGTPILPQNEQDNNKAYWDSYVGGTTKLLTKDSKHHIVAFFMEEKLRNAVVLDLGCGFGRMNIFFDIKEYHGLDISERMIREAKELNKDKANAKFYLGDGKTLKELKNSHFDYVACSTVMLHLTVETLRGYVKEVHRVLKVGGEFIVNFPKTISVNLNEIFRGFEIKKIDDKFWKDYDFWNDDVFSFKKVKRRLWDV